MPHRFSVGHFCFKIRAMKKIQQIKTYTLILPFILILSMLSSCSDGIKGVVERPKIQVHKVEMGGFSLSGGTANIVLDIQNPNRFSIPLSGMDYGIKLNGIQVAKGVKEQKTTIKGGESQKVSLPISLSFTNMMHMIPGLLRDRNLNYDLDGSVHLPWFNIPFQRSGQTTLR